MLIWLRVKHGDIACRNPVLKNLAHQLWLAHSAHMCMHVCALCARSALATSAATPCATTQGQASQASRWAPLRAWAFCPDAQEPNRSKKATGGTCKVWWCLPVCPTTWTYFSHSLRAMQPCRVFVLDGPCSCWLSHAVMHCTNPFKAVAKRCACL